MRGRACRGERRWDALEADGKPGSSGSKARRRHGAVTRFSRVDSATMGGHEPLGRPWPLQQRRPANQLSVAADSALIQSRFAARRCKGTRVVRGGHVKISGPSASTRAPPTRGPWTWNSRRNWARRDPTGLPGPGPPHPSAGQDEGPSPKRAGCPPRGGRPRSASNRRTRQQGGVTGQAGRPTSASGGVQIDPQETLPIPVVPNPTLPIDAPPTIGLSHFPSSQSHCNTAFSTASRPRASWTT